MTRKPPASAPSGVEAGGHFSARWGTQYTSGQLADAARELSVLRSMGRTGVCWDNARRRHSGIGYLSPLEYERRQLALAA
ncbi:hypothetical protein [Raineyella sp.]|uniref:hypothetical protein n=1 Tax=Raineyella sp. TaxID=1911550 RepID=UPI002B218312|nr:hypothetical protein [Raineyella sp.]MEA5153735.1 hypothetical protein [Raineyella sp.]